MHKPGFDFTAITTPFYCHDGHGHFLLHKRSTNCRDEQGHWDCGGGKLEFGEEPDHGVLREVREEYGCQGIIQEHLPPFSSVRSHEGKTTHWIALPYIILVNRDEVKINEPQSMSEIGWFTLDNFPEPLHSGVKLALGRFKNTLEKYR